MPKDKKKPITIDDILGPDMTVKNANMVNNEIEMGSGLITNIDYILNFDKTFDNTITYKLENNYRSTPQIINLASAIIKNNSEFLCSVPIYEEAKLLVDRYRK